MNNVDETKSSFNPVYIREKSSDCPKITTTEAKGMTSAMELEPTKASNHRIVELLTKPTQV